MIQHNSGNSTFEQSRIRDGKYVIPLWAPKGGLVLGKFPNNRYTLKRVCQMAELANTEIEYENEREGFQVGKSKATVFDDHIFTRQITFLGNALESMAAFYGHDLNTYPALESGQVLANAGHLITISADPVDKKFRNATLFPNAQIKHTGNPGALDGESTFTVEIETREAPIRTSQYLMPMVETFLGDGANANFKLGQGLHSGITPATAGPNAVQWTNKYSALKNFIYEIKVNGVITSAATYAPGIVTMNTAPANGAVVQITYFLRTDAQNWNAEKSYGQQEIVLYNNVYYETDTTEPPAGELPDAAINWVPFNDFGIDTAGPTNLATPQIPYTAGDDFDFMKTWTTLLE